MKYFSRYSSILLGVVVSALAFHTGDQGSIPCHNHQTFLIRLATFKITQILSPERASERKGMSTVEQFILVNLYSLDLIYTLLLLSVVFGPLCSTQQETIAPLLDM